MRPPASRRAGVADGRASNGQSRSASRCRQSRQSGSRRSASIAAAVAIAPVSVAEAAKRPGAVNIKGISSDHQGRGVGRTFAEWVLDRARDLGYTAMQFNSVVATNTAAVALWESLGFEIVGTVPDAFRHVTRGLTPVHVMYRPL